jgi:dihydrofolate reductase
MVRKNLILIASADRNWGIGNDNKLLKRIPEDMKRFAAFTKGNMIIVGRRTLETFKDKKPLNDRVNVVLTHDRHYTCEGAVIVHDLDELMRTAADFEGSVYVCGGETIYRQLLPYCDRALITRIDDTFEADAHLPDLDKEDGWTLVKEEPWQESSTGVRFRFVDYKREA